MSRAFLIPCSLLTSCPRHSAHPFTVPVCPSFHLVTRSTILTSLGPQVAELAKQVPTYHDFIPVENGRDLVMIKRKLETDQYNSIEALEADFDLMIRNCYTFNGTESQISFSARELSDKFKLGMKRIKTGKCSVTRDTTICGS